MLMLFLITAVLLEMAHDINHLLLLSSHYVWNTMLQSTRVGVGAWIMGIIQWYHRCAQGSCPFCYIFLPLSSQFHCVHLIHVKQLFDGERAKEEKEWQKGRWVVVVRGAGRRQWNGKIVSINLYLFRECWLGAYVLSPQCPVLYSHLHPFTLESFPFFLLFDQYAAHWNNWGLSALHRVTSTVIKAASNVLFTSYSWTLQ